MQTYAIIVTCVQIEPLEYLSMSGTDMNWTYYDRIRPIEENNFISGWFALGNIAVHEPVQQFWNWKWKATDKFICTNKTLTNLILIGLMFPSYILISISIIPTRILFHS